MTLFPNGLNLALAIDNAGIDFFPLTALPACTAMGTGVYVSQGRDLNRRKLCERHQPRTRTGLFPRELSLAADDSTLYLTNYDSKTLEVITTSVH